jgi:hypothetical protein
MKNKTIKINLFIIIIVAVIAILGGILGTLFMRAYVFNDIYSGAFSSELNLNDYNRSNLVIRDAKKVVVNQDVQVKESAEQIRESMLSIFTKKVNNLNENLKKENNSTSTNNELPDLESFYQLEKPKSTALIVSADGWAVLNKDALESNSKLIDNFIAISFDREIYEIDKQIDIANNSLVLIHLEKAANLKPVSFMSFQDLVSGQSLLAINSQQQIITNFLDVKESDELIKSSETFTSNIKLYPQIQDIMDLPWIFNFKGQAVAFLEDDNWVPLSSIKYLITNVLLDSDQQEIKLPSLGINYIDLSQVAQNNINKQNGALIYPNKAGIAVVENSSADKANLKEGDIILAINSLSLDENLSLSEALYQFRSGETVDLTVSRNNNLQIIKVEL